MSHAVLIGILGLAGSAFAQPSIAIVPTGGNAILLSLSGNGKYISGTLWGGGNPTRGFRWSAESGWSALLPTIIGREVNVRGVADDGTAVGEQTFEKTVFGMTHYVRQPTAWSPAGSMSVLVTPISAVPWEQDYATSISHDARVIAGSATNQYFNHSVVWRYPTFGYTIIPDPPLPFTGELAATSVSGDGSVVAGYAGTPPNAHHAYRWSSESGVVVLPSLEDPIVWPTALSFDGTVIVGRSQGGAALRWQGTVVTELQGGGTPTAVSGDGAIIVGDSGAGPVIWEGGLVTPLSTYLTVRGLDLTGWPLANVFGVSRDGRTFAGGNGSNGVWLATLGDCYPNCDHSTVQPRLNVNDFTCFLGQYAMGSPYANCDQSTVAPALNVADFICFVNAYATGCP